MHKDCMSTWVVIINIGSGGLGSEEFGLEGVKVVKKNHTLVVFLTAADILEIA